MGGLLFQHDLGCGIQALGLPVFCSVLDGCPLLTHNKDGLTLTKVEQSASKPVYIH